MAKTPKRPRDPNQLAHMIAEIATGESADKPLTPESGAAALGREGGLKGGKARAEALTSQRRVEIAKKAADARWKK